jgi:DNA repair protein RecN (Recombination protein N)
MLTFLSVKNLATVEQIKVEFQPGLNILTGSTGAGKSIILGSLGLVLGDKADSDVIRTGAESAIVEALFSLEGKSEFNSFLKEAGVPPPDESIAIRREVSNRGSSKAFLNDKLLTLMTLRQFGDNLVDLHGQHQHQSLLDVREHLEFIDRWDNLLTLRATLQQLYSELRQKETHLEQARQDLQAATEKRELYQFQFTELERANLQPGEEEELAREKSVLENVEKLSEKINTALAALQENPGSALENLSSVSKEIKQAASWDVSLKATQERLEESLVSLKELYRELESYRNKLEYDPARLEFIRDRLGTIHSLKKKYGKDINALIAWREELKQKLDVGDSGQQNIVQLEKELAELRRKFKQACLDISEKRKSAALKLKREILRHLHDLGLDATRFEISFALDEDSSSWLEVEKTKVSFDQTGFDQLEFLISPNPGEELKPLAKIVSGGELSRIMLALKSALAAKDKIPVLVFDEIDSGIGGEIAEAVGKKLKALSKSHQILCITHLQQIASFADAHYKVEKKIEKGRTATTIKLLDSRERVEEIARMISGEKITPLAQKQASLMIEQAAQL